MLELQRNLSDAAALGKRSMPDFQSYTIAISAHANSEDPEKVKHARRLLESLMNYVKAGEIEVSRNTAGPFSAVISAAAKSPSCVPGTVQEDVVDDGFTSVVDTAENAYAVAEMTYQDLRDDTFGIGTSPDHHAYGAFLVSCIADLNKLLNFSL
jgi:hypothetical protein